MFLFIFESTLVIVFFKFIHFFISGNLGFYKEKRHCWNQITFIFNIISNRQYSLCLHPGSLSLSVFPLQLYSFIDLFELLFEGNLTRWIPTFVSIQRKRLNVFPVRVGPDGRVRLQSWIPCNPTAVKPDNVQQSRTGVWLLVRSSGGRVPPLNTTRPDGYVLTVVLNSDYLCRGKGVGNGRDSRVAVTYFCSLCYHTTEGKKKKNSFDQD